MSRFYIQRAKGNVPFPFSGNRAEKWTEFLVRFRRTFNLKNKEGYYPYIFPFMLFIYLLSYYFRQISEIKFIVIFTLSDLRRIIYVFDSDLVWRMQLIIKVKKSCCLGRDLLNYYWLNLSYHTKSKSDFFLYTRNG